jgi:hypothetical protein
MGGAVVNRVTCSLFSLIFFSLSKPPWETTEQRGEDARRERLREVASDEREEAHRAAGGSATPPPASTTRRHAAGDEL